MIMQPDEQTIYPRWAAFVAAHSDDVIAEDGERVPWWRRLAMRLRGRRVWTTEQIREALGLPDGYRVRVNAAGKVRVWMPKEER